MSFNITNPILGLKNQLFTVNGTFLVPQNVYTIWVDGVGGGNGGAGGFGAATGGGGAGGVSGAMTKQQLMPVTPGETLTIVIGAGGTGAAIGVYGPNGGTTSIVGALESIYLACNGNPDTGTATQGGNVTYNGVSTVRNSTGGTNTFAVYTSDGASNGAYVNNFAGLLQAYKIVGANGGGPSSNGGSVLYGNYQGGSSLYRAGGTASGTLGGGGVGAPCIWGVGGTGGNGGAVGGAATGFGAGGGGGGCNAAGGNGAPGFLRLYWQG